MTVTWNEKNLEINIKPWILSFLVQSNLQSKFDFDQEAMHLEKDFEGLKFRFIFSNINLIKEKDKTRVDFVEAKLLIGKID